jgi:hypothetical protein
LTAQASVQLQATDEWALLDHFKADQRVFRCRNFFSQSSKASSA